MAAEYDLAFYAMLGVFLIVGLREFRKIFTDNAKLKAYKDREHSRYARWQGMFDGLPMAIEQTEAMLFEMKSKDPPPTQEQLEPIERRLKQLHTVAANQWWIELILKMFGPHADRLIKVFV